MWGSGVRLGPSGHQDFTPAFQPNRWWCCSLPQIPKVAEKTQFARHFVTSTHLSPSPTSPIPMASCRRAESKDRPCIGGICRVSRPVVLGSKPQWEPRS